MRSTLIALLAGACAIPSTWRAVSADHLAVVEVHRRGARTCVAMTGRGESCFDGVVLDALVFSEHAAHVAHPAQVGQRWTIAVDGHAGVTWDAVGTPLFSGDGTHLAYPAFDGSAWHVVADGVAGIAFDAIYANSVVFDSSGTRIAFAAARAGAAVAVVDGMESVAWDGVGNLTFSASGAHVAYTGRRGGETTLLVDGHAIASGEAITRLTFAAERLAYALREHDGWYVRESARRFGPYESVQALRVLSPGGELLYVVHDSAGDGVVIDGVRRAVHASVEPPVISRSGHRWGYVARDRGTASVFLGDSLVAREAWAGNLVIGASGEFAYLARRGDSAVIVDARGPHAEEFIVDGTLQLLRDDSTWTCLAGDAGHRHLFVVVAGSTHRRPFDWTETLRLIGLAQSTDALRAWVAAEGELLAAARPPRRSPPR